MPLLMLLLNRWLSLIIFEVMLISILILKAIEISSQSSLQALKEVQMHRQGTKRAPD